MTDGRRVYHYTARHHADEIAATGAIDRGVIPIPTRTGDAISGIVRGYQWLTTDARWAQGWATRQKIRCDRTECRLVVAIPILDLHRLSPWAQVARDFGYRPEVARRFAALGTGSDPATWFVFEGAIPYAWVITVEDRPAATSESLLEDVRGAGL
jgi:hypothetical protein